MSERPERAGAPVRAAEVRVRYAETDQMGVAYHGHYLAWFEIGRTELMRGLGCAYGELEQREGLYFPVVAVGSRYLVSARYDDVLEVRTRLAHVGGARVRFEYELTRKDDGRLLATGFTEHASVSKRGRPVRLPAVVRERLRAGLEATGRGGER